MKAIILTKYGSPDYLQIIDREKPVPGDKEVLVKIHATSVNSWDADILKGIPFANRMDFGIRNPKPKILGCDIAGNVEQVGDKVKLLKEGDEVFGDISGVGWGAFAEYVSVPEKILALKPKSLTFEEAAAMPHTGVLALQGLRNKGKIEKGKKVLINGAGGGAGSFAVQLAKSHGAEVTGVDSEIKFDMLRSIGADHVIDYQKEDFTKNGKVYDIILDVVTYRSIREYKNSLSPSGIYVMLGGGDYGKVFQAMWLGPLLSKSGGKKLGLMMHKPNREDLNTLGELFEAGQIKPAIDKIFKLDEISEALRYFEEGLAKGKLVIRI